MRTTATELVDMSKNAVSGFMPSISPFGPSATASTSAGTGSEVNTTSACSASAFGLSAQIAPFARYGSAAARPQIVHDELVPGLLQIGRHALAHHAEPDETDLHVMFSSMVVAIASAAKQSRRRQGASIGARLPRRLRLPRNDG